MWHLLPSKGKYGGILTGKFYLRAAVFDKKINTSWVLVIVYGAAQGEDKEEFFY
jgi:hypothetical protein